VEYLNRSVHARSREGLFYVRPADMSFFQFQNLSFQLIYLPVQSPDIQGLLRFVSRVSMKAHVGNVSFRI